MTPLVLMQGPVNPTAPPRGVSGIGPPAQLKFTVQPSTVFVDTVISPSIQVSVLDVGASVVPTATNSVTIAIFTGTGALGGTLTRAAINGVATFNNIMVDTLGAFVLQCTASGLVSNTSASFDVVVTGGGGTWPNEPSGWTVRSDYGFSDVVPVPGNGEFLGSSVWQDWQSAAGNGTREVDASAPLSPSYVYRFRYPIGLVSGQEPAVIEYIFTVTRPTEFYWGFWWKPSDPWETDQSGVNKIAFIWQPTDTESNLLFAEMHSAPYRIRVGNNLLGGGGPTAGFLLEPNITTTVITLGQWHQLEFYVKYSTGSNADGILKWWVDGILNGHYTDEKMVQDGGFRHLQFAPTWGGNTGLSKTEEDYFWIDHTRVSNP